MTVGTLLAEKIVHVVAHAFARAGSILPLTALLIKAIDKIRDATVAVQDDDDDDSVSKTTIYVFENLCFQV